MPDLSNLAALIAADVANRNAGRPTPVTLNEPVMRRVALDEETAEVWAVVRVDLGGSLTEIDVKRYVPAAAGELQARYARLDSGVQELRVADADGRVYGLAFAAPNPRPDDDEVTPAVAEPGEWDDWPEETDRG
ncbi:hypothetical protein [Amycolatopsis kentuckyensis]|uniref:hypothetical protein n=1 Tax=Amycolatopsis kentuckyensis TaxID=218823 RepID=UPI003566D0E0